MEITSAEFVISNTDVKKCPPGIFPEYAFIGRSNVGKSIFMSNLESFLLFFFFSAYAKVVLISKIYVRNAEI